MATATALRSSTVKSSPALRAFELNPFRILRLDVNVSTSDAANQAENALTLERVGLTPDEPDPLPWLPAAGSYELQQAAQSMEEPLVRLKHQMLWFDCVRDPAAELMKSALREPQGTSAQQYLSEKTELPFVEELPVVVESPSVAVEAVPAEEQHAAESSPLNEVGDVGGSGAKTGPDLSYDLEINFWESVRGTQVSLKITHSDPCKTCGGSGKADTQTTVCPSCQGNAKAKATCLRCDGSGRLAVSCAACHGAGNLDRPETLKVNVPAGIQTGARMRFAGKGKAGISGAATGDLYVIVKVQPHPFFRRNGDDIAIPLALTALEAAQGAEVEVPAVDGPATIHIPKDTKNGQKFRLREKGVWSAVTQHRGDQYVEVIIPSSEQRTQQLRTEMAEFTRQVRPQAPASNDAGSKPEQPRKMPTRVSIPADLGQVARAINQANLRLLLAAATIDGALGAAGMVVEPRKVGREQWKPLNGFLTLQAAHSIMAANLAAMDTAPDGKGYWGIALQSWTKILAHPWFRSYVEACIADLGDDYASADDVETVEESIRTHLVDLSAQEARFALLEGRYALAGSLITAMAESGMEARVLTPATRPLRHVFQSELSELDALLEQSGDGVVESVDAYLRRLESIMARWVKLDGKGIVGLRDMLDDAVEKAYRRLRNLDKPDATVDPLLARAGKIASAQSLRERVSSFQAELVESRKRLCQFCKTERPDYEKSVVLKGKKETGRETHYRTTTIHYAIQYAIVYRCGHCARLHDFVRQTGLALWLLGAPGALLLVIWFLGVVFS